MTTKNIPIWDSLDDLSNNFLPSMTLFMPSTGASLNNNRKLFARFYCFSMLLLTTASFIKLSRENHVCTFDDKNLIYLCNISRRHAVRWNSFLRSAEFSTHLWRGGQQHTRSTWFVSLSVVKLKTLFPRDKLLLHAWEFEECSINNVQKNFTLQSDIQEFLRQHNRNITNGAQVNATCFSKKQRNEKQIEEWCESRGKFKEFQVPLTNTHRLSPLMWRRNMKSKFHLASVISRSHSLTLHSMNHGKTFFFLHSMKFHFTVFFISFSLRRLSVRWHFLCEFDAEREQ